jgi:hypothetical protein
MKYSAMIFLENDAKEVPSEEYTKCHICNAIVKKISYPHHKRGKRCLEVKKFKHDLLRYVFTQLIG